MYSLPYFKENNPEVVLQFMQENSFVLLTGCDENNHPVATQVPVLLEKRGDKIFLLGHIMRDADHHKAFAHNEKVMAVFTGPHCYVSASWYINPKVASTLNYISVQASGRLRFLDENALREILKATTDKFENNPGSPANYEQVAPEYINRIIPYIVAFEIEVAQLENTFKLSQNQDEESYKRIIVELEKGDANSKGIAAEMQKRDKAKGVK